MRTLPRPARLPLEHLPDLLVVLLHPLLGIQDRAYCVLGGPHRVHERQVPEVGRGLRPAGRDPGAAGHRLGVADPGLLVQVLPGLVDVAEVGGLVPILLFLRGFGLPLGFFGGGAGAPTRASSASSPRSFLRCLQVRRSMAIDWLRHAGQEQE